MPRLMDSGDWARTVANVSSSRRIWCEDVSGNAGTLPLSLPEGGTYQVILVKLDRDPGIVGQKRKSAHDLIGYGKRFNREYRPTAEIMRELREGEDDFKVLYPSLRICNPTEVANKPYGRA